MNWIKEKLKASWKYLLSILGVGAVAIALTIPNGAVVEFPVNVVSETTCISGDGTNARFFAEVENGIVLRVIVTQPEFLNTGRLGSPDKWVETCYGGRGNRINYTGKGDTFDKTRDGFIHPKPQEDATLNETNLIWVIPNE